MNTYVFYFANAALYICMEGKHILIDGLHEGETNGFSPMPFALEKSLEDGVGLFKKLDAVLFTHAHADHFSEKKMKRLLLHKPDICVFAPSLSFPNDNCENVTVSGMSVSHVKQNLFLFQIGTVRVYAINNTHDGDAYQKVPHYSFVLCSKHGSLFVSGDASLKPSEVTTYCDVISRPLLAAFINVYQAASVSGKEYLKMLSPERIFLYHLPMPEDDTGNYNVIAGQLVKKWKGYPPVPEIPSHMSEIIC